MSSLPQDPGQCRILVCDDISDVGIDLLRDAGVDMASPEPVDTALRYFGEMVKELDQLL